YHQSQPCARRRDKPFNLRTVSISSPSKPTGFGWSIHRGKKMNTLQSSKNENRTSSARPKLLAKRDLAIASLLLASVSAVIFSTGRKRVEAQPGPTMLDPSLAVKTVVSGLVTPTSMAFLGNNDVLVLEKNTGRVKRVVNGAVQSTVLDLGVNFNSERGLLGI